MAHSTNGTDQNTELDLDLNLDLNLSAIRDDMIAIAKQGRDMILAAVNNDNTSSSSTTASSSSSTSSPSVSTQPQVVNTKKNSADLVTETDAAVESMISKFLMSKYPDFKFLGEETYVPGMKLGAEPTFVVDPIDGTTNFVHRHRYVSVSVGFAIGKEPVIGVVLDVFNGRLYVGMKSQGSYVLDLVSGLRRDLPLWGKADEELNGLDGTLVAIEWGSDRDGQNWKCKTETWAKLGASKSEGGAMIHSARALGSAALNLCGVAEGTLDLYWEGGCWAWDVCAGWIILKEAGGLIVDGNSSNSSGGGKWEIPVDHRKYLAVRAAKRGQKEIVQEFWGLIQGEMEYES